MLTGESKRGGGNQDGADASQEHVGAIEIRAEAQFSTETAQPKDSVLGPGMSGVIHKKSRNEEQDKDTAHAFQGTHTHLFNIQASFLVETIGVFELWTVAPLLVYGFGITGCEDRHIGEQNQVVFPGPVMSNQDPQHLLRLRQANLEPP